jgi:hypothetical protein
VTAGPTPPNPHREVTHDRRLAAALLAATGLLHLVLAPEYLDEKAYTGALFITGGLAALAIADRCGGVAKSVEEVAGGVDVQAGNGEVLVL